jgi:hypothetical protein
MMGSTNRQEIWMKYLNSIRGHYVSRHEAKPVGRVVQFNEFLGGQLSLGQPKETYSGIEVP